MISILLLLLLPARKLPSLLLFSCTGGAFLFAIIYVDQGNAGAAAAHQSPRGVKTPKQQQGVVQPPSAAAPGQPPPT
jgi:hypothetical protein